MLIGVDGTCWSNERGYGRFAREIVAAMVRLAPDDEFVCFVDEASARRFTIAEPNLRAVIVAASTPAATAASAAGYRSPFDMLAMTRAVARTHLDVFFSPSVYTYFPLPPRLRALVTIHDAIAERFPALTLPSLRSRVFWGLKMKLALHQATRVLTVSDYAASDVARVHGVDPGLIDVAAEAAAPAFRPRGHAEIDVESRKAGVPTGAKWFIYVGGFNPHKNVPDIIRAHARVTAACKSDPPHLILVIATVESPLPQLLSGGGIFVAPGDHAGIAAAMERLVTDETLRRSMSATALLRSADLTWERGATAALASLRRAAA